MVKDMKNVATVSDQGDADRLMELLKKTGIPSQTATTTEETGLEAIDILVEDDLYDQACDLVAVRL